MEIPKRRPPKHKPFTLQQLCILLAGILAVLLVIALLIPDKEAEPDPQLQASSAPTQPSSSVTPPTSSVITQPTTLPSGTFPPVTTPPATKPGQEYIGNLYTRAELEALDTTMITYGAGNKVDEKNRPTYALSLD